MRTGVLIILDGFGINPNPEHNAVAQARTPILDRLLREYPHTQIDASESNVGLPKGFMGNSEVGHLNIGAGRVVYQDFSLISKAIEDGTFYDNRVLADVMNRVAEGKGKTTLHLMGLVSDGGVHSHISHLFALLQMAKKRNVANVAVHVFTDGRDTSPTGGADYVHKLEEFVGDVGVGKIATVQGRFFAMDRDNRWERTAAAYEAIVGGKAAQTFQNPVDYIRASYEKGTTDEFLPPAVSRNYRGMHNGDGVIFFNFRADRARQLTRAMTQLDFKAFDRKDAPVLGGFVCMTPYEAALNLPSAYEKPRVPNTLAEILSRRGVKQLRIAETEKYAHVTYFFNGGEEKEWDGEKRILVPSPRDVKTYDLKPEMSALTITEKLLAELKTGEFQFVVVNFANPDMVGHTGNLRAAIRAVETVDQCLGKIVRWVEEEGAFAVITADHGNCEMMQDAKGQPLTSHTLLPVPFILVDPKHKSAKLQPGGKLCDIAPSLLSIWDIAPPKEMTGRSLVSPA